MSPILKWLIARKHHCRVGFPSHPSWNSLKSFYIEVRPIEQSFQIETEMHDYINSAYRLMGWQQSEETFYKTFESPVTYVNAEKRCEDMGGRLAASALRDPEAVS